MYKSCSETFWWTRLAARLNVRILNRTVDRSMMSVGRGKFRIKNIVLIYIVYFCCYGTSTGRYWASSTGSRWQIWEGHICLRSSDMAEMDPSAVDLTLAVRTCYVQDARRHPCQWGCTNGQARIARLWVSGLVPVACSSGKNVLFFHRFF